MWQLAPVYPIYIYLRYTYRRHLHRVPEWIRRCWRRIAVLCCWKYDYCRCSKYRYPVSYYQVPLVRSSSPWVASCCVFHRKYSCRIEYRWAFCSPANDSIAFVIFWFCSNSNNRPRWWLSLRWIRNQRHRKSRDFQRILVYCKIPFASYLSKRRNTTVDSLSHRDYDRKSVVPRVRDNPR